VAVVGHPDPEWGERVVACVVPADDVEGEALMAWAADRLAPYQRPRQVRLVDELPRNALGKVMRSRLMP
jgi:acyl-coenzyme A synthetase/AMP-(fatty) acid ligase